MYIRDFNLKELTYLGIGGKCDIYVRPSDINELQHFCIKNRGMRITCLGAMSNVIISDDGVTGVVVHIKNTMDSAEFGDGVAKVGAGLLVSSFIEQCIDLGISCCERMACIPGTIGGAISMNAGTPDFEISDVLIDIECIDTNDGNILFLKRKDIKFEYRKSNIPPNLIITSCSLRTSAAPRDLLIQTKREITQNRSRTQPIYSKTCGSTFKNPNGHKAWKLISKSGCSGMGIGGASVSDVHCNFIVNNGDASSKDVITLIEKIKQIVFEKQGIMLEEEIKVIE